MDVEIIRRSISRRQTSSAGKSRISLTPGQIQERIQKYAFDLYEKRGYSHGNDWGDWFEAEKKVRKSLR